MSGTIVRREGLSIHIVHFVHVLLLLANLVLPFSFLKLPRTPSNVPTVATAHNDETNYAADMFFPMVILAWVFPGKFKGLLCSNICHLAY